MAAERLLGAASGGSGEKKHRKIANRYVNEFTAGDLSELDWRWLYYLHAA
jgi:hypothetical protein